MPDIYAKRNKTLNLTQTLLDDRQVIINGGKFKNVLLSKRMSTANSFYQKNVLGHFGCVNAIEFNPGDESCFISGGDDRRILLWKTVDLLCKKIPKPTVMKLCHDSNVFCLAFTSNAKRIFSAGNDHQVILHDAETGEGLDVYNLDNSVHGITLHPQTDSIFCTACEDGRLQIFDVRAPRTEDPLILASNQGAFQSVMYNPAEGQLLVSSNVQNGVQLWDVRKYERPVTCYGGPCCPKSAMSARWNSRGDSLFVLRRRMMPVLYHINKSNPVVYFDHPGYYNSCTAKSGSFGGYNDDYVISGSDDFNLYMWKIPDLDTADYTAKFRNVASYELKGHRSIVNQARYSRVHDCFVSSGVEKVVKFWSVWPMAGCKGFAEDDQLLTSCNDQLSIDSTEQRPLYSHEEYIDMVIRSGRFRMPIDPDDETVEEDPRMIAFFDTLIQREIANTDSEDDAMSFVPGFRSGSDWPLSLYSNEVVDSDLSSLSMSSDSNDSSRTSFSPSANPRYSANRLSLLLNVTNGYANSDHVVSNETVDFSRQPDNSLSNLRMNNQPVVDDGFDQTVEVEHQEPSTSSSSNNNRRLGRNLNIANYAERNVTALVVNKKLKEKKDYYSKTSRIIRNFTDESSRAKCLSSDIVRKRVFEASCPKSRSTMIAQEKRRLYETRRSIAITSSSSSGVDDIDLDEDKRRKNYANFAHTERVNTDGIVSCASDPAGPPDDDSSVTTTPFVKKPKVNIRKRKYRQRSTSSSSSSD